MSILSQCLTQLGVKAPGQSRPTVLSALNKGPKTVEALKLELGVCSMTIRRHLRVLIDSGQVELAGKKKTVNDKYRACNANLYRRKSCPTKTTPTNSLDSESSTRSG
jgi:hypothetical protein